MATFHTPRKDIEQERKVDPSTLEQVRTVYGEIAYIPAARKPGRFIPMYRKNGLPLLEFQHPSGSVPYWYHQRLHPENILTPFTPPLPGDFLQLLDANGKPSENHTEIFNHVGTLGDGLFLIEDMQGESYACARNEQEDNDLRRAWIQVITATA